ncbi:hypothetical protein BSF38_00841 [Paludisphaera borealis]|uniref:Uncharacterized protein n=1 Tax=Paludisphaera borealis TaxID=1387353 RepID=A0A1U7CKI7_9BACT|nr:hypothetical protein BSF38_00841 [Paludisphaera borealis]
MKQSNTETAWSAHRSRLRAGARDPRRRSGDRRGGRQWSSTISPPALAQGEMTFHPVLDGSGRVEAGHGSTDRSGLAAVSEASRIVRIAASPGSMSIKGRERTDAHAGDGARGDIGADLSAGPGMVGASTPPYVPDADSLRSARVRMLEAEASQLRLDGQVFWLTAHSGLRTAFPPCGSGMFVRWPDRLQRRPRAGFPPASLFSPTTEHSGGGTCRVRPTLLSHASEIKPRTTKP